MGSNILYGNVVCNTLHHAFLVGMDDASLNIIITIPIMKMIMEPKRIENECKREQKKIMNNVWKDMIKYTENNQTKGVRDELK